MARICLYSARFEFDRTKLAPLGLGYLAAYAMRENGIAPQDVRIVDSVEEGLAFEPDIVGVGSVSHVTPDAVRFARRCKEDLGSGQGAYVDLDPQSCRFARDVLGIRRVLSPLRGGTQMIAVLGRPKVARGEGAGAVRAAAGHSPVARS